MEKIKLEKYKNEERYAYRPVLKNKTPLNNLAAFLTEIQLGKQAIEVLLEKDSQGVGTNTIIAAKEDDSVQLFNPDYDHHISDMFIMKTDTFIKLLKKWDFIRLLGPDEILISYENGIVKLINEQVGMKPEHRILNGKHMVTYKRTVFDKGLYQTQWAIEWEGKLSAKKPSTFFPNFWTPQEVMEKIREAFEYCRENNIPYTEHRNTKNYLLSGFTKDGINIFLVIDDKNDEIIWAYPKIWK